MPYMSRRMPYGLHPNGSWRIGTVMSRFTKRMSRRTILLVGGACLLLWGGWLMASEVVPGSKAAGMKSCVAPTEDIRRHHMDYLKHQRDETVHRGIRGAKYSIADCVDCHAAQDANGKYIPVNAEGQFCQKCHAYAAVSPPCFQCHRKTPQSQKSEISSLQQRIKAYGRFGSWDGPARMSSIHTQQSKPTSLED